MQPKISGEIQLKTDTKILSLVERSGKINDTEVPRVKAESE